MSNPGRTGYPTPWPRYADWAPRAGKAVDDAAPLLVALGKALDGTLPPCAEDPVAWTSSDPADVALAVPGCEPCPALDECAAYARAVRPRIGTWAGRAVYVRRTGSDDLHEVSPPTGIGGLSKARTLLNGSGVRLPTAAALMRRDTTTTEKTA